MLPEQKVGVIVFGTTVLALLAGYMNSVAISLVGHGVSHVTGTTTLVGQKVVQNSTDGIAWTILLLLSFLFGSFISGVLMPSQSFSINHKYNLGIGIEAALVATSAYFLSPSFDLWTHRLGEYCLACGLGLQNSMCAHYSKAIIRTTHMTGIVSDIGAILGQLVRRQYANAWKLKIFVPIYFGFMLGAGIGAEAGMSIGSDALWFPALFLASLSAAYTLYRGHEMARKKIKEIKLRRRSRSSLGSMSDLSDLETPRASPESVQTDMPAESDTTQTEDTEMQTRAPLV
jgi:uncharacterized membrane protein YoaK (UPF0700 family)